MSKFNYPDTIPRDWLVWEWLLDGNANDTSGSGNNWTATNVTWVSADKWYVKECGSFDGSSSNITFSAWTWYNLLSFTYWLTPTKITDWWVIWAQSWAAWKFINQFKSSQTPWFLFFEEYTQTANNNILTEVWTAMQVWKTYLIKVEFNNTTHTANIYVNWQLHTTSTANNSSAIDFNSYYIWNTFQSLYYWWTVWLFRIYNKIITTKEDFNLNIEWLRKLWPWIMQQYPELFKGCVWYWDFRNGSLSNIIDWTNATNNWATLTTDHLWNSNSAYSFNWSSSYITIPSNTNWDLWNNYFISTQIYINSLPTTWNLETIIYRANTAWTGAEFEFVLYNNNWTQQIFVSQATTSNPINYTLPVGRWINLSVWYNWTTITFYLDWGVIWTVTQSTPVWISNKVIDIGRNSANTMYFNWQISYIINYHNQINYNLLYELTKNKYIYQFSKYTPVSLPKPVLHIDWTNDWTTFYDQSGNGNHWTQSGGVTSWRIGQSKWIGFNGSSQYIDCWVWPTITNAITISARIKQTAWWTNFERIINKYQTNIWYEIQLSNTWVFQFEIWDSNAYATYYCNWTKNLKDWKWHFVCGTFDTTNWILLYVDWKPEAISLSSWTIPTSIWVSTNNVQIWRLNYNWIWYYWNITILLPSIYNQALSPKQIEALYYSNYN